MLVYIEHPMGPARPWVAKFGSRPIESLAMMLGYFADNSEQFVVNPKRIKFPPPRGFHVEGGSWKFSGSSSFSATYFFLGRQTMHPTNPSNSENIPPPNHKLEATL